MREPFQNQPESPNSSEAVRLIRFSRAPGFTLIEMLITMALIIIMFTMLWGFGSPSNQREQKKRCQANLQKMYIALQIYAHDNHDDLPFVPTAQTPADALDVLVPKYTVDTSIFICPGGKGDSPLAAGESLRGKKISYAYYMGWRLSESSQPLCSDQQVNSLSKTNAQPLFSATGKAPGNNHHKFGGNILFCDGHIESSPTNSAFSLTLKPHVVLLNP